MNTFVDGQTVQVASEHHWAKGAVGTIAIPPAAVRELTGDWNGCFRSVNTVRGVVRFYWVEFREPQADADGEGPYAAAEVEDRYLTSVV